MQCRYSWKKTTLSIIQIAEKICETYKANQESNIQHQVYTSDQRNFQVQTYDVGS